MASFTMPLKKVIELTGGEVDFSSGIAVMTGGNIGLATYPIFDEAYRPTLNGKIIDHFWNREIGVETVDMFQMAMRRKMNEIMPYYNKLYLSEQINFDPLSTIDIRTLTTSENSQNAEVSANSTTTNESESGSRSVTSETPQTMLSGSGDYATGAADSTSKGTVSAEGSESSETATTGEASSESHTTGYQGVGSDLLMRYRETILNIDLAILNDLDECFMFVWDNGDAYTRGFFL